VFNGQLLAYWLKYSASVLSLVIAPLVLYHVVEPVLDPGQVAGVIDI